MRARHTIPASANTIAHHVGVNIRVLNMYARYKTDLGMQCFYSRGR